MTTLKIPNISQSRENALQKLEIRLDTPTIYDRKPRSGVPSDAVHLRGRVIFMNQEPILAKSVQLNLKGEQKILWYTDSVTPQKVKSRWAFIDRTIDIPLCEPHPGITKSYKIEPGNHVWPFEIELEPDLRESINGMGKTGVSYHLEAIIRRGYVSKNIRTKKILKVVHIEENEPLNQIYDHQAKYVLWKEKLRTSIETNAGNIHWGSLITAKFDVFRLAEGVKIHKITMKMRETLETKIWKNGRDVFNRNRVIVAETEAWASQNPGLNLEDSKETSDTHQFRMTLPLPRDLRVCRQSVSTRQIQISHDLLVYLTLHDGKTSGLASLFFPFHLTFPFAIAFDEKGVALGPSPACSKRATPELYTILTTPPLFGEHHEDPLVQPGVFPALTREEEEMPDESQLDQYGLSNYISLEQTEPLKIGFKPKDPICLTASDKISSSDYIPPYGLAVNLPEIITEGACQPPSYST